MINSGWRENDGLHSFGRDRRPLEQLIQLRGQLWQLIETRCYRRSVLCRPVASNMALTLWERLI